MTTELIGIQRRINEVGRIRLGRKVGDRGGPERLDKFRFTSPRRDALEAVASLYGGEVQKWDDAPTEQSQGEVFTDARVIEVLVPPATMALSQAFEDWTGGACQRRCNGERDAISDGPCICAAEMDSGQDRKCKPTTRLNVMLPALGTFGVWRLETHGYNAAAELAGAAELAQIAAASGRLNSAKLRIEGRTAKRRKRGGGTETRHFVVPVLDLDLPLRDLLPGSSPLVALEGGGTLAPDGAAEVPLTPVDRDALPPAPLVSIEEQFAELERRGPGRPRSDAAEPIRPTGRRDPQSASHEEDAAEPPAPEPDDDERPFEPPAVDPGQTTIDDALDDGKLPGVQDDAEREVRARNIAIAGEKAGLDDEGRHRFLYAASGGAYVSAREVPPEHVAQIMAGFVKLKRGEIVLENTGTKAKPEWRLVEVDAGDKRWNRERWMRAIANVPGVGQVKLLKEAIRRGDELGIADGIHSLDDVNDPRLVMQLLEWLRNRQTEKGNE